MGLWDKLRGEFVDIIEWTDDSGNTLVNRFERYQNEIKYGAKLVVRASQAAVFVDRGQIADVFNPGMYELETKNLPILSTLLGWKYGFHSPFKAEVYFVSTRQFTDLKWGTLHPVMLRDAEFGPVRLRAFGTYAIRVADPGKLIREIAGTDAHFTTQEITEQLRNLIVTRFADLVGESRIPVLDLAANYNELGDFVSGKIAPEFQDYGLALTKMLVENISLPPAVEEALDKRTSMGVIGNLQQYAAFQAANAMEKAADNPGGTAAGGMGMGMGFAMANQMGQAMAAGTAAGAAGPPPVPQQAGFFIAMDGQQAGPFDLAALRQQVAARTLTAETLVWKQGLVAWQPAAQMSEVAALFRETPPPIPPRP